MNAPFRPAPLTLRLAALAEGDERAALNRFLAAQADATPFHRPEWIEAAARGTGNKPLTLLAERDRPHRFEFEDLFQSLGDETFLRLFSGDVEKAGMAPSGTASAALARRILDRDLLHRAFALRD